VEEYWHKSFGHFTDVITENFCVFRTTKKRTQLMLKKGKNG